MATRKAVLKLFGFAVVSALLLGVVSAQQSPVLMYSATLENGDVDGSGVIDITDPILLVHFLYLGGSPPVAAACQITTDLDPNFAYIYGPTDLENGDVNGDGVRDISDFISLITWEFVGGDPPVPFECLPPVPPSGQ